MFNKLHKINEIKSYNSINPNENNFLNDNDSPINLNNTHEIVSQISSIKIIKIKELNGFSKENLISNINTTSSNNQNNNLGNSLSFNNINNQLEKKKSLKNKNNILKGSISQRTIEHCKLINPLIPPPDPLIKRTNIPALNPKFGKMKSFINLPKFIGEEPITKFEYKPNIINLQNQNEKMYEANFYINSHSMLGKLIYLKSSLNKDGCIEIENIINVKKLNNIKNENNLHQNIYFNNNENNKPSTSGSEKLNNNLGNNLRNQTQINKDNIQNKKEPEPYYTLKSSNDETLIFESRFESGNLLCAFRGDDENSYQLYLQNDTNTTGYIQWFFFRVSNTRKGKKVNFNIINMLRKNCLY